MDELISKKEMLKLTGISYGQLYRWKRQRLIPESWFMKQSTFTGQETFFPRERILERISTINELKDQYSLDELAQLLAPNMSSRTFMVQDLERIFDNVPQLYRDYFEMTQQKVLTFIEIVLIEAIRKLTVETPISEEAVLYSFLRNVQQWRGQLEEKESYRMFYCSTEKHDQLLLVEHPAKVFVDTGTKVIKIVYLEDIVKHIHIQMKSSLGE